MAVRRLRVGSRPDRAVFVELGIAGRRLNDNKSTRAASRVERRYYKYDKDLFT